MVETREGGLRLLGSTGRGRLGRGLVLMLALLVAGLVAGPPGAHAQGMDPASVVTAFIAGENAHDVNAVTALFTDNATVSLATGPLQGTAAIRAWQQELSDGHFSIVVTSPVTVSGTKAHYTVTIALDTFRQLGLATLDGTEDMTVENGKISDFVFAFTPESGAKFQQALQQAQGTPGMPKTGAASSFDWWAVLLGSLAICLAGWALRRRATFRA